MKKEEALLLGFAVLLSGLILFLFVQDSGYLEDSGESNDGVIYSIYGQDEWVESAGDRFWTRSATKLVDGKFMIDSYGQWKDYGYSTAANYRTQMIDTTDNPLDLGELVVNAYLSNSTETAAHVIVFDCTQRPENPDENLEYCWENGIAYNSSIIDGEGEVEFQDDLSGIRTDGYVALSITLLANTTEPIPDDRAPYVDSVRLRAAGN